MQNLTEFAARLQHGWFYAWFMYEFAFSTSGFIQCCHIWK